MLLSIFLLSFLSRGLRGELQLRGPDAAVRVVLPRRPARDPPAAGPGRRPQRAQRGRPHAHARGVLRGQQGRDRDSSRFLKEQLSWMMPSEHVVSRGSKNK